MEEACKAAHSESGWHGFRTAEIEALTGLADLAAKTDKTVPKALSEAKEVSAAVKNAAALFAGHVREVFARLVLRSALLQRVASRQGLFKVS